VIYKSVVDEFSDDEDYSDDDNDYDNDNENDSDYLSLQSDGNSFDSCRNNTSSDKDIKVVS
jgi:hypothetical protein